MNKKWLQSVFVLVVLLSIGLSGCQSMKVEPSKGVGFVPVDEMSKREDLPFQRVWVQAGVDWNRYKTIYIKDVSTKYLMESNWWQKSIRKDDMVKDARNIAQYMQDKFKDAFRSDPKNRFQVVASPQPGSLTLELALTELVPSHPGRPASSPLLAAGKM